MKLMTLTVMITLSLLLSTAGHVVHAKPEQDRTECVIVLHGMGQYRFSMKKVSSFLESRGYKTVNLSYPATPASTPVSTDTYLHQAIESCVKQGADKVHIITHPSGGIVIKQHLKNNSLPRDSRILILGPPNKNKEGAEALVNSILYKCRLNETAQNPEAGESTFIDMLGPVEEDIGIIAGTRTVDPVNSFLFTTPSENILIDEMDDFICIPKSHPFITSNRTIMHQIEYYLEKGKFDKASITNPDLS